jgi:hypothetical protein
VGGTRSRGWTQYYLLTRGCKHKSVSKLCYDRRSVGQSILVSGTHLGPKTRFLLLSDSCVFVDAGYPLWREDGSVVYNCCWSSPAQSFSGPSPAGLMTIFYCLRFETLPTWRTRSPYFYPPLTGWPRYTPRNWVPVSSPPATRRATVEVFEHASTRGCKQIFHYLYIHSPIRLHGVVLN